MLASHGIMDYSMLLGIENKFRVSDATGFEKSDSGRRQTIRSKLTEDELKRIARHIYTSPDGSQIFHFSIIDFLQLWNCNKKTEHFLKTKFKGAKPAKLSAIEPQRYKVRF
jgi:hypothetical protein